MSSIEEQLRELNERVSALERINHRRKIVKMVYIGILIFYFIVIMILIPYVFTTYLSF